MAIIDAHAHVVRQGERRVPLSARRPISESVDGSVEAYLDLMDDHGVEQAVLVALFPGDEYVRACLQRFPGRFHGIELYDHRTPMTLEELRQHLHSSSVRGIRMFDLGSVGPYVEDLPTFPLLSALASRGQVLWLYPPRAQVETIRRVVEALPHLSVVLNHLAYASRDAISNGGFDNGLLDLAAYPNVSVLVSGHYAFTQEAFPHDDLRLVTQRVYGRFGASRMLWASDRPWATKVDAFDQLLMLPSLHLPGIGPDELAEIMGGTAARLLSL